MVLANELFERKGAHTRGERRPSICPRRIDIFLFVEKVVHGRKYGAHAISASHFGLGAGLIYSRQLCVELIISTVNMNRILVPIDFSNVRPRVIGVAQQLATALDAELQITQQFINNFGTYSNNAE